MFVDTAPCGLVVALRVGAATATPASKPSAAKEKSMAADQETSIMESGRDDDVRVLKIEYLWM